jgi:multidrug efflux pump subunit AcrA (membrane-fusion protein)
LQQLRINIQLAESELSQAHSRLIAAKNRRQVLEFDASVEATKQEQQRQQLALEYSRAQSLFEQSQRDKDFQLAELQIKQAAVDDKLSDIPIVRSPKSGYVRKIKPWVGRDGKYTTVITLVGSSLPSRSQGTR